MKNTVHKKYFLRDEIGNYMSTLGKMHSNVIIVNADLMGTCRNFSFVEKYPKRAFNVGIAEQNLVSFSAGLAHEGMIPYAFSMAPFISMRACEQCRTDVAYAGLNVRLIATYAGVSGGISGATHWALEDCAIMGSVAGMTVLEPSDPIQAKRMLEQSVSFQGPIYMRSSIEPVRAIYNDNYKFEIGKASIVKEGTDGAYICAGIAVQYALNAANIIKETKGKHIRVIDMHTFKPIDEAAIVEAAQTKKIVIAHDHNIIGGLGYSVAAVIAKYGLTAKIKMLGCPDKFLPMAHANYLYQINEYDTNGLVKNMMALLEN